MKTYDAAGLIPDETATTAQTAQTVYVGSLWYSDCDPFATIVATDYATAKALLAQESEDEAERTADDDGLGEDSTYSDIMTGGVFAESLDTLNLSESELADLSVDGYVWVGN